jgi:ABC-type methionine transport system ATPase subunit
MHWARSGSAAVRPAAAVASLRSVSTSQRLFVSFPEELVDRPMVYEIIKRYDVIPSIRRANVEAHSGWTILEITGEPDAIAASITYLEELGCTVNRMEGDVLES